MDILRIISLVKETKGIITNREMAAHVKEKGVADYVTQVDVAVQDFLKRHYTNLHLTYSFSERKPVCSRWIQTATGFSIPLMVLPTSCTTISTA